MVARLPQVHIPIELPISIQPGNQSPKHSNHEVSIQQTINNSTKENISIPQMLHHSN